MFLLTKSYSLLMINMLIALKDYYYSIKNSNIFQISCRLKDFNYIERGSIKRASLLPKNIAYSFLMGLIITLVKQMYIILSSVLSIDL